MLNVIRKNTMLKSTMIGMRKTLTSASCVSIVAMSGAVLSFNPAVADESVTQAEFDGSKVRVNLSTRLRSINEKMAGTTCRVMANHQDEDARADLLASNLEYTKIMKALRESNATIGVPTRETKPRVLSKIWEIELQLVEAKYAANQILRDIRIPEYVDVISRLTAPEALALSLDKLESEIVARYTNPNELLSGDAFTISLVARQRKIIQEISKLTCAVATDQPKFGTIDDLQNTMALFEKSLSALETGLPAAGISSPPTEFISERLANLRSEWTQLSNNAIEAAGSLETLSATTEKYDALALETSNLVSLYMLSTPGQADLYSVPLRAYAESQLKEWIADPALVAAVKAQNAKNAQISQSEINALDQKWRAEVGSDGAKPMVDGVLELPVSKWLAEKKSTSGGLLNEVILMDNKGLNVAVSTETTDFWQGDEDKWKQTYGNGSGRTHVSAVEFNQKSGTFQSQISLPVSDPATGELIGAVTFGVNVQSFL